MSDPTVAYGPEDRLIALPEVMSIVGCGKTIIYRWVREGTFPEHATPAVPPRAGARQRFENGCSSSSKPVRPDNE